MRVRWTTPAAHDLYRITRRIRRDNPEAAREVAQALYDGCESLATMPYRGRNGRRPNTREFIFPDLPYIAVYRVVEDVVEILHFYHGAQDWH